ncbi:MAG: 50S ribosomal protein L2 [Euryarchaeota archaeon]|nr:50S ribosomal protein L2 [Euryarchaeota archaeon]
MGKPITSQRRGKGGSVYRAPSHRYLAKAKYRPYDQAEKEGVVEGRVVDILVDPARSVPLLKVEFSETEKVYLPAVEGVKVGDVVSCGTGAEIAAGNYLPLGSIREGTPISNIEINPGDGGKLIRSSGTYGTLISHEGNKTVVQLPSGTMKTLDSRCRATVGIMASGGRRDKPLLKGGKMFHMTRSKAKYWPIVRKVAMNVVNHPFGGNSGAPGKPATVSRNRPPGRKVGLIAARRTGRR